MELFQIINTAIIKSKEKAIETNYEARLQRLCNSPELKALNKAISYLAEAEKLTKDEASLRLITTIRELDRVWSDYIMMEGLDNLKEELKKTSYKN